MTENKRFTIITVLGDWGIKDTQSDELLFFATTGELDKTVDMLNSLAEENEQLKKDIQEKGEIIELYQGFCGGR